MLQLKKQVLTEPNSPKESASDEPLNVIIVKLEDHTKDILITLSASCEERRMNIAEQA